MPHIDQQDHLDRRQHVAYLTQNREYHCRGDECVGVRDRRSGSWLPKHIALRARLLGAVTAEQCLSQPEVGLRLFFVGKDTVLTSAVQTQIRPEKHNLQAYTSICFSGLI